MQAFDLIRVIQEWLAEEEAASQYQGQSFIDEAGKRSTFNWESQFDDILS